ncbi:Cytoplasmic aconitate hydratase [Aphelenchoides besseyi]|nr:Cytoplasmic aconitate hydratase [Aphelenchoides besseyi]
MAFNLLRRPIEVNGKQFHYYAVNELDKERYEKLPISIRYLLESAVRNCDGFHVKPEDVDSILNWEKSQHNETEIPFCVARVLLQDFTGVPAIVDLASMRDAVKQLGGNPDVINPICSVDLVIDHSVQVDYYGSPEALAKNQEMEMQRNKERFNFLKFGAKAFTNLRVVPPGSGIVHQVNLEYLAHTVFVNEKQGLIYPDSVVGTDSHTTMICGAGVLGWGVGGIEAEAVMLGQAISMVLPEVIGYRLVGHLPAMATSTDLVLTITKNLRDLGVVGKFVEFFGPGVAEITLATRATISNMTPEFGATVAFFAVDKRTIQYLRQTRNDPKWLSTMETYLKNTKLFVDFEDSSAVPNYTKVIELDLSTIEPSVSGPKRPQDLIPLKKLFSGMLNKALLINRFEEFKHGLTEKISFKGFGLNLEESKKSVKLELDGETYEFGHGSVVISAITSCTNTSNPSVMLAAGLVARNARRLGLKPPAYVKTSLSPGSEVVTKYLKSSHLLEDLAALNWHLTGYGCQSCIGNSGELREEVARAIEEVRNIIQQRNQEHYFQNNLVVAGVLSGNRNFEGRIHPHVRANYLASPPLVVVYGLAGRVNIDLEKEPIGEGTNGPVYFNDIWPTHEEIAELEEKHVKPQFFQEVYQNIQNGSEQWQQLVCPEGSLYQWDESTYIKRVPFFDGMTRELPQQKDIVNAYALLKLGDSDFISYDEKIRSLCQSNFLLFFSVTTDHISPAGAISRNSPAAKYLMEKGVAPKDFNTYGARRGHDEVMTRGTFANIRLVNQLVSKAGPKTLHIPSGEEMSVFDAAMRYKEEGNPIIILAGKDYGCGSSRDWAAKGPLLQGVRAVIAESFERIHRSNLVGMGIVPLMFLEGENAETLELSGKERFTIKLPIDMKPGQKITVLTDNDKKFDVKLRVDTAVELTYVRNGGVLHYMVRKLSENKA